MARALVPFPPRIAAAGGHQALLRWLALLVSDAAGGDSDTPTPAVGACAAELLGTLFPAAPALVRAQCCADVCTSLGHGIASARHGSPGGVLWRAATAAWAAVARAAAAAVVECASTGSSGVSWASASPGWADAWDALARTAHQVLLMGKDVSALGMLCAASESAHGAATDAQQLAKDEALLLDAVNAVSAVIMTGAMTTPKAGGLPATALAALIAALHCGTGTCAPCNAEQRSVAHSISVACMRQLCALASPRVAVAAGPAMAALLEHCALLLQSVSKADVDTVAGADTHACDALLAVLEALSELRSNIATVDAAIAASPTATSTASVGMAPLLSLLRTAKPERQAYAHVLLVYAPLVGAIHARDARIRAAVSGELYPQRVCTCSSPEC